MNFSAQQDIPLQQAVVDVAINIKEDDDGSGDDNELQIRLKVDNVTGQAAASKRRLPPSKTADNKDYVDRQPPGHAG